MCVPFNSVISLPGDCPAELFIHVHDGAWKRSSELYCLTVKPGNNLIVHFLPKSISLPFIQLLKANTGSYPLFFLLPSPYLVYQQALPILSPNIYPRSTHCSCLCCHCLSPSQCWFLLVLYPTSWPPFSSVAPFSILPCVLHKAGNFKI